MGQAELHQDGGGFGGVQRNQGESRWHCQEGEEEGDMGQTVSVRRCSWMPCLAARPTSARLSPWNAGESPCEVSTRPSQPLHWIFIFIHEMAPKVLDVYTVMYVSFTMIVNTQLPLISAKASATDFKKRLLAPGQSNRP